MSRAFQPRDFLPGGCMYMAKQILDVLCETGEPLPGPQIRDILNIPNSEHGELLHMIWCLKQVDFVQVARVDGTTSIQITDEGRRYLRLQECFEQDESDDLPNLF
uniref:Uncharacterized protein n=1 Tax=Pithovirus LCPAC304 TaxID=2506594 RepID=A0A481Z7L1_9VIRU|nr:MAG: hypothetical protein LCPAC304_00950 [Pithovirus LCPAC304]